MLIGEQDMVVERQISMETRTMVSEHFLERKRRSLTKYAGFDDVIYPVDYKVAGHIVDDDMHDIMYGTVIRVHGFYY